MNKESKKDWEKVEEDVKWLLENLDTNSDFDMGVTLMKIQVLFEDAIASAVESREREISEAVKKCAYSELTNVMSEVLSIINPSKE